MADTRIVLRGEQNDPARVREVADKVRNKNPVEVSINVPTPNDPSDADNVPPEQRIGTVPLMVIGPCVELGPAFWARAGLAKASPLTVNPAKDVNAKVRKAIFQYPLC